MKPGSSCFKQFCCSALAIAFAAVSALAGDGFAGSSVGVMQENDLVVRTDRHYTQGLKFTFFATEHDPNDASWVSRWAGALPALPLGAAATRYGIGFGQNIYTPTNIAATTLQVNDRPYAALLYGSFMLQQRGTAGEFAALDHWQLDLGIIGPQAFGEEAQNTVHRLRKFDLALGWGNQLTTEPALALKYERIWRRELWRQTDSHDFALQFLPQAGVSLGNIGTYAGAGCYFRFGWRVPDDFSQRTIDSITPHSGGMEQKFGCYAFIGAEGRAVAYNALLDGNLLHASHHVSKHPLVGDLKLGFVLAFKYCDLAYTQIVRSKEFVGQREIDSFGSLALRVKWGK
ncbi:MAG: lipid A deacylase LpxR family protein [Verrucomicrobia bacterium]|nr:lipid A deacylase LpxR family protein [Verrucomicrobiota bacterium]